MHTGFFPYILRTPVFGYILPAASPVLSCTRNFLTFVKTTAIAYGQKMSQSLKILVACDSGRFYKRQKITSTVWYRPIDAATSAPFITIIILYNSQSRHSPRESHAPATIQQNNTLRLSWSVINPIPCPIRKHFSRSIHHHQSNQYRAEASQQWYCITMLYRRGPYQQFRWYRVSSHVGYRG